MAYKDVFEDWRFLFEEIGPADDMTGGYVDQQDLDELLKSPTKKTATYCMRSQISYWFQVGPDMGDAKGADIADLVDEYPRIDEIAEKYGESY